MVLMFVGGTQRQIDFATDEKAIRVGWRRRIRTALAWVVEEPILHLAQIYSLNLDKIL
jgi:hypothetical protein